MTLVPVVMVVIQGLPRVLCLYCGHNRSATLWDSRLNSLCLPLLYKRTTRVSPTILTSHWLVCGGRGGKRLKICWKPRIEPPMVLSGDDCSWCPSSGVVNCWLEFCTRHLCVQKYIWRGGTGTCRKCLIYSCFLMVNMMWNLTKYDINIYNFL